MLRAPTSLAAAGVLAGLLSLLAACGTGSSGGSAEQGAVNTPSPNLGTVVDEPVPAAIANLPLTTAAGRKVTLADYRGKPVMITDFLTLCTDICPLISANAQRVAASLRADGLGAKTAVLEVSVDPQRDTVARLRAYQRLYGAASPGWTLARTSPAHTKAFWNFFHVWYHRTREDDSSAVDWYTHRPLSYDVNHSDAIIFLDGNGRVRFVANSAPDVQNGQPPKKLVKFLNNDGHRALRHPDPVDSWTVSQAMSVFSWIVGRHLATSAA